MNIIIPMAGMGKRMRPHTLTVPKPLLPIAGKSIVQRLVEDIAGACSQKIDQIAFIIGDFGKEVEEKLLKIAESVGAEGQIFYQKEALGTGHAVLCAEAALEGPVVVAFADTLFRADFDIDTNRDGIIWVQKVDDPSAFGVVTTNNEGIITDFVEKPETFVSNLAIIGIYYFKDGNWLREELNYLIDNNIREKGEYQLTNALENMKSKGAAFTAGEVNEWLDCGNKDAFVYTNKRYLEILSGENLIHPSSVTENCTVIPPVFVDKNVTLRNSVIGPFVSIGKGTTISDSVIKNSVIGENSEIKYVAAENSMSGNFVKLINTPAELSIGDFNELRNER